MEEKKQISLISSMGGSGTTSFIAWFNGRTKTNCAMNSEGLRKKGGGANARGLKHRIKPPKLDDPYLHVRVEDGVFEEVGVKKALFIFDTPYNIIPSLFRRKIAMGHAKAITGVKAIYHQNSLDEFCKGGVDSFKFAKQFDNWSNCRLGRPYQRMLIKFPYFWEYIDTIFDFLEIPSSQIEKFPPNKLKSRKSSFKGLEPEQKEAMVNIYRDLDRKIKKFPKISII